MLVCFFVLVFWTEREHSPAHCGPGRAGAGGHGAGKLWGQCQRSVSGETPHLTHTVAVPGHTAAAHRVFTVGTASIPSVKACLFVGYFCVFVSSLRTSSCEHLAVFLLLCCLCVCVCVYMCTCLLCLSETEGFHSTLHGCTRKPSRGCKVSSGERSQSEHSN